MLTGPHPIHTLELRVREIDQLFNSLDSSPFLNKDLDRSCEAFIESWALALPHESRLHLTIFVEKIESTAKACELVSDAIHNYYRYKAECGDRCRSSFTIGGRSRGESGSSTICALPVSRLSRLNLQKVSLVRNLNTHLELRFDLHQPLKK
jgi:hypothetical protein